MDTEVSIQRPRPQNLSLCLGTGLPDLKSFTASLRPHTQDWSSTYRPITSATLKNGSLIGTEYQASLNRAELENELKEQMAALNSRNTFIQAKLDGVSQNTSDKENIRADRPYQNSSPDSNSETQNSGNLSTRELELFLENKSSPQKAGSAKAVSLSPCSIRGKLLEDENMLKERAIMVEKLENDLRRVTEEKILEVIEKVRLAEERDALKAALEQKANLLESVIGEKAKLRVEIDIEVGNKTREITDLKTELTTVKAKHDQLHREVLVSKIINDEKHKKITTLEKEVASLVQEQENSQKVYREMHEAKVMINEFNEKLQISAQSEFCTALQLLLEECKKSQEALKEEMNSKKQLSDKIKLMEEKALSDVASFEKEKEELTLSLREAQNNLEKTKSEFCSVKEDLSQTILNLDSEKTSLTAKLAETETLLKASKENVQAKEVELNEIKMNAEHEKCKLQGEISQCKKESVSSINEIKNKNMNLQSTVTNLEKERVKLQEKLNEYTRKLEASLKEIADLKAKTKRASETEASLRQEKEKLQKMLKESQVLSQQHLAEFQQCIMNKDLHIQALISDVNQMKEFIVEHHGESVFENEDTPAEEEVAVEETGEEEQQQVIEIPEDQEEEVVEQIPTPTLNRNYQSETIETTRTQNGREELTIYKPKTSVPCIEEREEEYSSKRNNKDYFSDRHEAAYVNGKFDPLKDRKLRDEEITQKQLEKMVLELNEKVLNSDKRAKKMVEEKLLEAAKAQQQREDELLAEMDKLKDEKKALLKKIDDMQWDQAYQYTQKAKLEKEEEEKALEAANKQKQQALEASKKKKKK